MRINCPHCQSPALITHSKKISKMVAEAYCVCKSDNCAARFVMRLIFSHDICPPIETQTNALYEQIANMNPEDRRKLLQTYRVDYLESR